MLAVDTNVLVRYFTRDDLAQAERARSVMAHNEVFISKTVFLETEWVLRRTYRYSSQSVISVLKGLISAPNVTVEDAASVMEALRLADQGMDFADAMHVASAESADGFVTFDQDLVKAAKGRARLSVAGI